MRPLRRHLTYANVMSSIAVFAVLATGGAYAANTVFSEDIVDGEVKSRDVLNETLTSGDVLNNSLRAADIGPDEIDTSEIAPDAVTGEEVDESTLTAVPEADSLEGHTGADLDTKSFQQDSVDGCDPTTSTMIDCGVERLTVTVDAPSDVVVHAEGVWFGDGAGEDVGECRIEGEDFEDQSMGGARNHLYGQAGSAHDSRGHGAALSQTATFQSLDPGAYEFWLLCRELDADFEVDWVELTGIRLGGDPLPGGG